LGHNLKKTFAITEKAEFMVAIGFILLSATLAMIGGLSAPIITNAIAVWQLRLAIGLTLFVVIQFGIITPFRMWREATWVANIEKLLEELWDSHDTGVELLNAHIGFVFENPDAIPGSTKANDWVETWVAEVKKWTEEAKEKVAKLYPLEGHRFKNIVVYQRTLTEDCLNLMHREYRNQLLRRLQMLENVVDRHQPTLLPE